MKQVKSMVKSINSTGVSFKKGENRKNIIKESDIRKHYELFLHSPLGKGVSGEVFKCKSKETGSLYALKILKHNKRGKNEITFHTKCQESEYVVPIIDVFTCAGHHPDAKAGTKYFYVVMELQKGSLFTYIRDNRGVKEETAVPIMKQIVSGLHTVHKHGIIHRDLKPENILISEREGGKELCVKLCDFGTSCEESSRPTRPEYTPFYVAPEVLCKDNRYNYQLDPAELSKPYDRRCDIWALGVILYCMLSSTPPFFSEIHRRSVSHTMFNNVQSARYKFDDDIWKDISPEAKDLISRLLRADPTERLTLEQVLEHPWMSTGKNLPLNHHH